MNGTDISMTTLYDDLAVLANSSSYTANLQQNGTQVYGSDGKTYTTAFVSGWLSVLIRTRWSSNGCNRWVVTDIRRDLAGAEQLQPVAVHR